MLQEDMAKYKDLYLQTAKAYLTNIEENVSALLLDQNNTEAVKHVLLDAHSLKSQSLLMKFDNIGHLCEVIEKICRANVDQKMKLDINMLILIQNSSRKMIDALAEIEKNDRDFDLTDETNKLKNYLPSS